MTQTVSFKEKFKSGFALFKWELKSCTRTLFVFSLLAGAFLTIVLTLCIMSGLSNGSSDEFDYEKFKNSITAFQYVAAYLVFFLNAVFTIVYTIRIYSYLHNKRKADLYGSMPISRRTFYISKTVSAYLLSIIPALFFFGMISLISVCFGVPVNAHVAMFYVKLLIGAIACISFYGLLAVCCGTTLNTVLSFIAINFAYPVATLFIKATIRSFFTGMSTNQYNSTFIMKALSPLSAYGGANIIYWILFTAACLFLGILLVKKRRAECAQTSFAFYLPCHIVKLLVSFISGMFLGTLFGSINVFSYGYLGFIFGFILGSIPTYIITHLIMHRGFSNLVKSAIPFASTVALVFLLVAFCNFDPLGYNRYVPNEENIESAGLVDLGDCCFIKTKSDFEIANMASDDYNDNGNISSIVDYHRTILEKTDIDSHERFGSVWSNLFISNVSSEYFDEGYCVAYRLNNGKLVYRYYDRFSVGGLFISNYINLDTDYTKTLTKSDTYFINYSALMNNDIDSINDMHVIEFENTYREESSGGYWSENETIHISENQNVDPDKVKADREKLMEAYRADVKEFGKENRTEKPDYKIAIKFDEPKSTKNESLLNTFIALVSNDDSPEEACVYSDYKNTIEALKEIGVLKSDGSLNEDSCPYKITGGYEYPKKWR